MLGQEIELADVQPVVFDLVRDVTNIDTGKRNDSERLFGKSLLVRLSLNLVVPMSPDLFDVFAKRRLLNFVKKVEIGDRRWTKLQP